MLSFLAKILFNEVETKDLCTVRYNSTSNKALLFCCFEVCLDRHILTDYGNYSIK
jgi:hypothetical protein